MILFKNSIMWLGLCFDFVVVGRFIVMRRPNFVRSLMDDPSLRCSVLLLRRKMSKNKILTFKALIINEFMPIMCY